MSSDAERSDADHSLSAGLVGNQIQENQSKQCSVRGCTQSVSIMSSNKMCEACRGRHRIYASTKRARRKLEKAVVASVVRVRNRNSLPSPTNTIAHSEQPGNWISMNDRLEGSHMPQVSMTIQSTPTTSGLWDHTIDPCLLATSGSSTTKHHSIYHQSSSELANALTLPTSQVDNKARTPGETQEQEENPEQIVVAPSVQTREPDSINTEENTSNMLASDVADLDYEPRSDAGHRICSVRGCRTLILASYEFKMCPPCRIRYRTYGTTKRAKWKAEREAFEQEIVALRSLEDERRKQKGLPALSESPEELHAWELAVTDGQALASLSDSLIPSTHVMHTSTAIDSQQTEPRPSSILQTSTLDADSILIYPNQQSMGQPLPKITRTCTISHCRKILPDLYPYKHCEQHRAQTRQRCKLKRDREREAKAAEQFNTQLNAEGSRDDIETTEIKDQTDGNGKEKTIQATTQKSPISQDAEQLKFIVSSGLEDPTEVQKQRHICSTKECLNLLTMARRSRMCANCLSNRRSQKRELKKIEAGVQLSNLDNGAMPITFTGNDPNGDSQEDADGEEDPDVEIQTNEDNGRPRHITPVSTATAVPSNSPSSSTLNSAEIPFLSTTCNHQGDEPNSTNFQPGKAEGRPVGEIFINLAHSDNNGDNESETHCPKEKPPMIALPVTFTTPTVPNSTPFVYNPPAKKKRASIETNSSFDTNSSYQFSWRHTPVAPTSEKPTKRHKNPKTSPTPISTSTPSNPYPYPSPSHPQHPYPYYVHAPYGMTPYVIPAVPNFNQTTPSSTSSSSLSTTSAPPNVTTPMSYLPYPYPYGYPLPAMGYMTPQYPSYPYGPPTSGYPPLAPYGPKTPPTVPPTLTTVPFTNGTSTSALNIPTQNPSAGLSVQIIPQFTYYHHGYGHSSSITAPTDIKKKRKRTVFPVKDKISPAVSADVPTLHYPLVATPITIPRTELTSTASPAGAPNASTTATSPALDNEEIQRDQDDRKRSSLHARECANKSCHRIITTVGSGIICDKCRMRFKKHQAKAKQRFRLEPRRPFPLKLTYVGNINGGPIKE